MKMLFDSRKYKQYLSNYQNRFNKACQNNK